MVSQILPNLFLGNFSDSEDLKMLKDLNIKYIINLSEHENNFPKDFIYLKIDIKDDGINENIKKYFRKTSVFIYNGLLRGNVFVHCHAGISRSPAIVMAFLIKKKKYSFNDALIYIKNIKNSIEINEGFLEQLKNLEK